MTNKIKIFVSGHNGMVGSALVRHLEPESGNQIITANRSKLDLTNQQAVNEFFKDTQPDQVYLAAAKVGGIYANNEYPADFIYQNLMIQANVIRAAHDFGVEKLLFLGSSCIYPKLSDQPMREEALLSGMLEPTNEPYAIAKIAGIKLCESYNRQYYRDYRSIMPTNLYGPRDNFHLENSHVIPALIRRFHQAKIAGSGEVTVWGTGSPMREFLHVDDMVKAAIHIMNIDKITFDNNIDPQLSHINVGTGDDCSIKILAETIAEVVGYEGSIKWDSSKPDGTSRKLLDVQKLRSLGWESSINLEKGLTDTYRWYIENIANVRHN